MLLNHITGLFTHPDSEWDEIKKEHTNPIKMYAYIGLLALIGPACAYYATTQVGWRIGDGQLIMLTSSSALILSVLTYIAIVAGVYILGFMIDWMSKTYGSGHDEMAANGVSLAAYSCTPLFLAGFVGLYPEPWINVMVYLAAAAYAGYLIYDGLPHVLGIPKDQAFFFTGAILTFALVYLVITLVGTVIIWSVGFGPEFISG